MAEPLVPGSASHAADQAARAAVKTPEFRAAAAAAHGEGAAPEPTGAPDPEPEEVETETPTGTPDEGPSPSPEPSGDDDDETVEDDYDEEDHAVDVEDEPEADRPKTTDVPAVAAPKGDDDVEKTWAQYKTEDERKKALAANKKYGIEQANRAKALQAEVDALKAGTAAAPAPKADEPPTDPAEGPRKTLERLYHQDPKVKAAVDSLGTERKRITARIDELTSLSKKIADGEGAIKKLDARIEYLQEEAKADPENFELTSKIDKFTRERDRLDTALNRDQATSNRMEIEKDRWLGNYQTNLDRIDAFAEREHRRSSEEARSRETLQADTAKAADDWTQAQASVLEELKVPESRRKTMGQRILREAAMYFHANPDSRVNPREWILSQAKIIESEYSEIRSEATRSYTEQKKRDAAAPAPRGQAAVAKAKPAGARFSAKDADRQAASQMKAVNIGRR
jgi:hypothetical protein